MTKKTFTTAYNRSIDSVKDISTVKFTSPSKVKESLEYATDLNQIYENYCRTGKLPLNGQKPIYDENFIKYDSLIEAQKLCSEASAYFAGLPSTIKNEYGNDLVKFIKALNNKDEFLVNQGLLQLKTDIKDVSEDVPSSESPSFQSDDVNTAITD